MKGIHDQHQYQSSEHQSNNFINSVFWSLLKTSLRTTPPCTSRCLVTNTRSSQDKYCTRSNNHLWSKDLFRSYIIEFNRSTDLDGTAPPFPIPTFPILVVHWRSPGCFLSPIHHLLLLFIFLPFCLFVSLSKLIFNGSYLFIIVHVSSLKFGWYPSESCVLSFCLSVLIYL